MKSILNIFLLCFFTSISAFASFNYNNNLKNAHKLITELRFEDAEKILNDELKNDKSNSVVEYNLALIPFIKAITNENQTDIKDFLERSSNALKIIKSDNSESPFKRYLYADLLVYRAVIHAKEESYLSALLELKKAYQSIEKNKELYKHFLPNQKINGIMNIVFGSVPDNYTWLLSIFNIQASVEKGEAQLYLLTQKSMQIDAIDYLFNESFFIYSYAKTIVGNKDYKQINDIIESDYIKSNLKNNAILTMAVSSFYQKVKKNDKAIECLESYTYIPNTHKVHFLDFMLGESYLYKLKTESEVYFKAYLKNFPGSSYKKSAWQKLAWINAINNDEEKYYSLLEKVNQENETILDSDKQAQKEFENRKMPNLLLLKSRLLFDGGYYNRASKLLENDGQALKGEEKIEYLYRLGRINDELKNYKKALKYYELTISYSEKTERYFPANAALQSAYIYESLGNKLEAEKMYKLCFELEYTEYRSSITQKAKAGLNRLEN